MTELKERGDVAVEEGFGLEVLSPVADPDDRDFAPARRVDSLSGKTVGLAWNRKPGGNVARERVARFLEERVPDVRILRFDDDIPFAPATVERIVEGCDAVIGTTADCGACSSWLAHDMIEIEKAGVPSVMITAREFIDDASLSMSAYGMPDLPTAVFDGIEFTSSPDEEIISLIEPILEEILEKLTSQEAVPLQPSHRPASVGGWADRETFRAVDSYEAWQVFNREFLDRGWGAPDAGSRRGDANRVTSRPSGRRGLHGTRVRRRHRREDRHRVCDGRGPDRRASDPHRRGRGDERPGVLAKERRGLDEPTCSDDRRQRPHRRGARHQL
jgi:hypothetical protein